MFTIRPPSRTCSTLASSQTYGQRYSPRRRSRKALTARSSSPHRRLTSLLLMPSIPSVRTRASTLRVLTPRTYASATMLNRARSARRRGSSSQSRKYDPRRSFGMSSEIVRVRVSRARRRWPLR